MGQPKDRFTWSGFCRRSTHKIKPRRKQQTPGGKNRLGRGSRVVRRTSYTWACEEGGGGRKTGKKRARCGRRGREGASRWPYSAPEPGPREKKQVAQVSFFHGHKNDDCPSERQTGHEGRWTRHSFAQRYHTRKKGGGKYSLHGSRLMHQTIKYTSHTFGRDRREKKKKKKRRERLPGNSAVDGVCCHHHKVGTHQVVSLACTELRLRLPHHNRKDKQHRHARHNSTDVEERGDPQGINVVDVHGAARHVRKEPRQPQADEHVDALAADGVRDRHGAEPALRARHRLDAVRDLRPDADKDQPHEPLSQPAEGRPPASHVADDEREQRHPKERDDEGDGVDLRPPRLLRRLRLALDAVELAAVLVHLVDLVRRNRVLEDKLPEPHEDRQPRKHPAPRRQTPSAAALRAGVHGPLLPPVPAPLADRRAVGRPRRDVVEVDLVLRPQLPQLRHLRRVLLLVKLPLLPRPPQRVRPLREHRLRRVGRHGRLRVLALLAVADVAEGQHRLRRARVPAHAHRVVPLRVHLRHGRCGPHSLVLHRHRRPDHPLLLHRHAPRHQHAGHLRHRALAPLLRQRHAHGGRVALRLQHLEDVLVADDELHARLDGPVRCALDPHKRAGAGKLALFAVAAQKRDAELVHALRTAGASGGVVVVQQPHRLLLVDAGVATVGAAHLRGEDDDADVADVRAQHDEPLVQVDAVVAEEEAQLEQPDQVR
eukprot:Rhum_TRINITY_DN14706_c4_g1::Rhum_TRINITY_DN14706_c4_g1_i1::g.111906::m.111906